MYITMDRYETAEIPLVYLPVSSIYTANVDISIADESIATAEIKDYELLEITPHKAGKTTITITSDSGEQVSYNIVVEPRIYKILLDIYVFFMSLIGPFFIPLLPFFM